MEVSVLCQYFCPCNEGFKKAADDFKYLELDKKVAVVALTVLAALGSVFLLGLGAIPVFRLTVEYFIGPRGNDYIRTPIDDVVDQSDSDTADIGNNILDYTKPASGDSPVKVEDPASDDDKEAAVTIEIEEDDRRKLKLAQRWGSRILPVLLPETQIPLQIMQTGSVINEAIESYQSGEKLNALKKVAPIVIVGAAVMSGGPVVAAGLAAYKVYSTANLIMDTIDELARDEEGDASLNVDEEAILEEAEEGLDSRVNIPCDISDDDADEDSNIVFLSPISHDSGEMSESDDYYSCEEEAG